MVLKQILVSLKNNLTQYQLIEEYMTVEWLKGIFSQTWITSTTAAARVSSAYWTTTYNLSLAKFFPQKKTVISKPTHMCRNE